MRGISEACLQPAIVFAFLFGDATGAEMTHFTFTCIISNKHAVDERSWMLIQ